MAMPCIFTEIDFFQRSPAVIRGALITGVFCLQFGVDVQSLFPVLFVQISHGSIVGSSGIIQVKPVELFWVQLVNGVHFVEPDVCFIKIVL